MTTDFEILIEHVLKVENYCEKNCNKLYCNFDFNNDCIGTITISNNHTTIITYHFNLIQSSELVSLSDNIIQLINDYLNNIITFDNINSVRKHVHDYIDDKLSFDELTKMYNIVHEKCGTPCKWFFSTNINCNIFGIQYVNGTYVIYDGKNNHEVSFDTMVEILNKN